MRTPPVSPWIVRGSVRIYRRLLCLGPRTYRHQYADLTLQLFRECCQDAYRQRGTLGVLRLWLPLFSNVIVEMLAERLSESQNTSGLQVSVETVSASAAERRPSMDSVWQRINHQWIIPPLSALTRFRRKLTRPLLMAVSRELNRPRSKYPANMDFEQHLRYWRFMGGPPLYESGIDTTIRQTTSSAFLRSTIADTGSAATLRQTIKADEYRGKHLRFSGDVKVEQVEQQAGLWIEPIVQSRPHRRGERLKPENAVRGTREWVRYEETISIPEDTDSIRFGIVLHGKGQIWLTNAKLEVTEQGARLSV